MLIVKIFNCDEQIDELQLKNIGQTNSGYCKYEICSPEQYRGLTVLHHRIHSWEWLVGAAIDKILSKRR